MLIGPTNLLAEAMSLPPQFWISEAIKVAALYAVMYLSAQLVLRCNVLVNYTRKINHFAIFFLPILLWLLFDYEQTDGTRIISSLILLVALIPLVRPVRRRVGFFATCFRSIDRPEDRPKTIVWLMTQVVAGYLVVLPVMFLLDQFAAADLIMIPVLTNAIGDGLAEPVGVRFGRHPYTTRAVFSTARYTRTVEGSACVYLTAVIVVLAHAAWFTPLQLAAALLLVPPVMTIAEARAPHTWDTPYLFLAGGLSVVSVLALV